jgi:hypothetical protein
LYYITFPTSKQIFLWIIPLASICIIKQIHPLKFSTTAMSHYWMWTAANLTNSTEWQQAFLLCPEKWHCTHIMNTNCIAHHVSIAELFHCKFHHRKNRQTNMDQNAKSWVTSTGKPKAPTKSEFVLLWFIRHGM